MVRDADVIRIAKWGTSGTADVATATDTQVGTVVRAEGWPESYSRQGGDYPSREVFNRLMREFSALAVEINTHGVLEWDANVSYIHPAVVMGSDNSLYVSVISNSGHNPVTDASDTYWKLLSGAGWTPVYTVESDGDRRVLKIIDWTGGTGAKPLSNVYISSSGFVTTVANAIDIRGLSGPTDEEIDTGAGNDIRGWSPARLLEFVEEHGMTFARRYYELTATTESINKNAWPGDPDWPGRGANTVDLNITVPGITGEYLIHSLTFVPGSLIGDGDRFRIDYPVQLYRNDGNSDYPVGLTFTSSALTVTPPIPLKVIEEDTLFIRVATQGSIAGSPTQPAANNVSASLTISASTN